ncbi:hypothetical protein KAH55_01805 [bacterium]|nr:hypothetical protein [bacterium]
MKNNPGLFLVVAVILVGPMVYAGLTENMDFWDWYVMFAFYAGGYGGFGFALTFHPANGVFKGLFLAAAVGVPHFWIVKLSPYPEGLINIGFMVLAALVLRVRFGRGVRRA